jgi:hypothetical protein
VEGKNGCCIRAIELTRKLHSKRVPMYIGIARKIIFRFLSIPRTDGFMNIFIRRAKKDILIKSLYKFGRARACMLPVNVLISSC